MSATHASTVIDLSALIKMEQLAIKVQDHQVVFIGETHDRYDHHLNQLAIIRHQYQHHPDLVIGMEFIQQPFQPILDDYVSGKIDEEDLLKETEYFKRWGYDFRLYRPIFAFARENNIPILALNIDKDITDKIKSEGIENLSEDEKSQLPAEINREDTRYAERLKEIYMLHPHADEKGFEDFMQIQLLWDEGMAETAAKWLKQNPQGHMIVLSGSGHVIYGSGIPDRLKRRVDVSIATIINSSGELNIEPDMGDFIVVTDEITLPPSGKLGVMIDATQNPPLITGFGSNSGAKDAGIEKKDKIIRIGEKPINSYYDVRIALMDMPVDETVSVEVEREGLLFGKETHSYEVILQ